MREAGIYCLSALTQRSKRHFEDYNGVSKPVTVCGSPEQRDRDDNGAGECGTAVESRELCRRGSAGVLESGTVPKEMGRYFTATTPLQSLEY